MRILPALLPVLFAAACTTTTTTTGTLPQGEDRIHVSVVDAGTSRGVRVEYVVDADLPDTARAILEVEARPENSELVTAARIVLRNAASGRIILRFHPALGVPGEATYRYWTDDTRDDEYGYRFQITPAREGGPEYLLRGSYTARATDDGCRVIFEFTSTHAALRRDHLMRLIRADSTAVMNRAEGT
ncbi:MAG: hypothetical protein ABFS86_16840 [Planctomycetota bacterium]